MRAVSFALALLAVARSANAQSSSSTAASSQQSPSSSASTGSASPSIETITTSIAAPTGNYITYTNQITVSTNGIDTTYATVTSSLSGSGSGSVSVSATATSNGTVVRTTAASPLILTGSFRTMTASNGTSNSTASRTSTSAAPTNTQACNNYVEFCNRRYMNVTEVCAHNSAFTTPNNAARNQDIVILGQLNDGVRMIQGETHWVNNTMFSCHSSCDLLNAGPLVDELTTVREWVAAHAYDVVTILLVNSDYRNVTDYVAPILEAGLAPFLYIPPKVPMHNEDWPTYSEMILSNKRVVIFMDYQANQTQVPYVLDEFSQMWETPFSPTSPDFPCDQQRPPGLNSVQQSIVPYLANHNLNVQIDLGSVDLLIPNFATVNTVNAANSSNSSLLTMAQNCNKQWGRPPAWLLVDFYNAGNTPGSVFEVAAQMNNVTYNRPCCGQTTSISAASGLVSSVSAVAGCALAAMLALCIF